MFTFEDIIKLDDISIQKILKEVNIKDVAIALKGVDEQISNLILKNQSSRAAQALKEEISLILESLKFLKLRKQREISLRL